MLTQNLINLIESGQAQFKNITTGGTGASRIPVPKNNYIVITDFHWHHFSDRDTRNFDDVNEHQQMLRNTMHALSFRSYGLDYYYAIRSSLITQAWNENETQKYAQIPFQTDSVYDCYQVHKTDCHVTIWKIPSVWSGNYGRLNDSTTEERSPVGYGTSSFPPSFNCQTQIDFGIGGADGSYVPFGNQQYPDGTLPNNWRNQFRPDVAFDTILPPTDYHYDDVNFTYPLMNISYVLVNHPFDKNTR